MMNVNRLNQNNNYGENNVDVGLEYSSIQMGATVQGTGNLGNLIPVHAH